MWRVIYKWDMMYQDEWEFDDVRSAAQFIHEKVKSGEYLRQSFMMIGD